MNQNNNKGRYNFVCKQGETFNRTITWTDSEGTPVDLGGFTASMAVATAVGASPVMQLTSGNSRIVLGDDGEITLNLTAAQTASIPASTDLSGCRYLYDLKLVSGSGVATRLLQGTFTVLPQVTT